MRVEDRHEQLPRWWPHADLLHSTSHLQSNDGAGLVIDGFPRTALQVCVSQRLRWIDVA